MSGQCIHMRAAVLGLILLAHPGTGTAAGAGSTYTADWWQDGQDELANSIENGFKPWVAKNAILFIGDGMGASTVTATRIYNAQTRGLAYKDSLLGWEHFPYTALVRTYTTNRHVTDSAAASTAFLCGEKTHHGFISMGQNAIHGNCTSGMGQELKSILKFAQDEGKWTGVVTTTRVTHATPAAAYATTVDRDWESDSDIPESERALGCTDIASQLIDSDYGKNIRVILGGGRREFYPEGQLDPEGGNRSAGMRLDGRNLTQDWLDEKIQRGYSEDQIHYVMSQSEFDNVDPSNTEYLLGLFEAGHMQYESYRNDPLVETWGEPSLAEMTEKAIQILQRNPKGYYLLVEGGRIDHAHHANTAMRALNETMAFSDAVNRADTMTNSQDTLLVISADHSHSFTIDGYATIEKDILGLVDTQDGQDGLPYSTLGYTNGPGWEYHRSQDTPRKNLTEDSLDGNLGSRDYEYDAGVWLDSETHAGEDVAVYARGPMSHLFKGVRQQHFIAHAMMYASCVGPNKALCEEGQQYPGCPVSNSVGTIFHNSALLLLFATVFSPCLIYH